MWRLASLDRQGIMSRKKIHGNEAPVRLPNADLPSYVVIKRRRNTVAFYHQVPKRLRPAGWPGSHRLPLDPAKRSGRGNKAELAAVATDAKKLYARMLDERPEKGK